MGYEISISEDGKYVIVEVLETVTWELAKNFMADSLIAINAHGLEKVLVDVSKVQNQASIFENYKLAYEEATIQGVSLDLEIVVLVGFDDKSHDFIETVFRNAGYKCKICRDKDSAIEMIKK